MQTFTLAGNTYKLEFRRQHKEIPLTRDDRVKKVKSRHPYTTATLFQINTDKTLTQIATAEVGCAKGDVFSKESGRKAALRVMCAKLRKADFPRELNEAIWKAYLTRGLVADATNTVH